VADLADIVMKMLVIVYLVKQWNDVIREANKTLKYVNQLRITVNNINEGPIISSIHYHVQIISHHQFTSSCLDWLKLILSFW
jgi:hypothetical protein